MMNTKQYFASRCLLPLFFFLATSYSCTTATETENRPDTPWFFVQITDTQLGFYPDSLEKEIQNYEQAVKRVNEIRPDFVVITGDLVNNQRDEHQLAEFKRITGMISNEIPVYLIPGNHDVGNEPSKEDVDFYKSIYGDDKFSFVHKEVLFAGINSNLIKAHTAGLEEDQWEWIKGELSKGKDHKMVVMFSHHPFFSSDISEAEAYFNLDSASRKQYFDLFSTSNVKAVFAGHHHQNGYGIYNGIEMVTTSAVGEPLGKDPVGLRLIKIGNNKIHHQYFALDSIPDQF